MAGAVGASLLAPQGGLISQAFKAGNYISAFRRAYSFFEKYSSTGGNIAEEDGMNAMINLEK
jgi:hypothetical protein